MNEWEQIRDGLGDKVVDALIASVTGARNDLAVYRATLPGFAYEQSGRGLAGWVHDRMWRHVVRNLFEVPGVVLHESGPTREVIVGIDYRLRLKRHSASGGIRNYKTPAATAFWEADPFVLPGLEETRLCFGYVWDGEAEEVGDPVMSRRTSQDKIVWMERLDEAADGGTGFAGVEPIVPPSTPNLPRIDLPKHDEKDGTDTE